MPQSRAEVGRGAVCRKRWEFSPVCSEQEFSKVSGQPQNLIFFGPRYDFRESSLISFSKETRTE